MADVRLKTALWVQACVMRGNIAGGAVVVAHKGDDASGAVLLKINSFARGCTVLVETRDGDGERAWLRGTGPEQVTEQIADDYIQRNLRRDPDVWVVEIEDHGAPLPFDGKVLKA